MPFSRSPSVSSIQVENVVNEPSSAVPASSSASPVTPAPCKHAEHERSEHVDGQRPEREGAPDHRCTAVCNANRAHGPERR